MVSPPILESLCVWKSMLTHEVRAEGDTNVDYTKGSDISVSHSSVRKFMYVTAYCMSCMHHVDVPRRLPEWCVGRIFGFLQVNFAEFLFHAIG